LGQANLTQNDVLQFQSCIIAAEELSF
jgi:hypothetical protein